MSLSMSINFNFHPLRKHKLIHSYSRISCSMPSETQTIIVTPGSTVLLKIVEAEAKESHTSDHYTPNVQRTVDALKAELWISETFGEDFVSDLLKGGVVSSITDLNPFELMLLHKLSTLTNPLAIIGLHAAAYVMNFLLRVSVFILYKKFKAPQHEEAKAQEETKTTGGK